MDEQVFLQTLKKIRWSTNRDDLASATRTTLELLLRRPTDHKLRAALFAQLDGIIGRLPASRGGKQSAEIRQAAVRCVVLLQSAKRGRLSRVEQDDLSEKRRHHRVLILVAATAATAALYLFLMPRHSFSPVVRDAGSAIVDALKSPRLGLSKHDNITIRATHEHTIVTAERMTPEDCITAARAVQTMGEIAINDTAVGRPNDSKFSTLCRQMGDATLSVTVNQYRAR